MLVLFVEFREFVQRIHNSVYPGTSEALAAILFGDVGKFTFFVTHYRSEDKQFRSLWNFHDLVDDILRRPSLDFFSTNRAVRHANPCKQQTQIVINFSHCCDS